MTQKDQLPDGRVKPVKDATGGDKTAVSTARCILFARHAASKSSRIMGESGKKKLVDCSTFIASLTVPLPSRSLCLLCDAISVCRCV